MPSTFQKGDTEDEAQWRRRLDARLDSYADPKPNRGAESTLRGMVSETISQTQSAQQRHAACAAVSSPRKDQAASSAMVGESSASAVPTDPPPSNEPTTGPRKTRKTVQKEYLNPRHLHRAPASHTTRLAILMKLRTAMAILNQQLKDNTTEISRMRTLILSADELTVMALDEEEHFAKDYYSIYRNMIGARILALQKMELDAWLKEVQRWLGLEADRPSTKETDKKQEPARIKTGLTSNQEIAFLSRFYASKTDLQKCGYVLEPPSEAELLEARNGAEAAKGWEQCERCGSRFQVFPGRKEDGTLTTGGSCTYHYARPVPSVDQGTLAYFKPSEPVYPCCHAPRSSTSPGCTTCSTHVFKVTGNKRLASILQFEKTPARPHQDESSSSHEPLHPLSFDCEMCYTTLGLELVRLTAASWPEATRILDVLVRPMGEILDFNTRYSGVSAEDFSQAIPYDSNPAASEKPTSDGKNRLTIVNSITEARSLLFSHLTPSTPLIGHSMDNDLNVCRIIHPTIVDTALLFPHPRGLPMRSSLRILVQKYLGRHIQAHNQSTSTGHDSFEDAAATGDLVRWKIRFLWPKMKKDGWSFDDKDNLVAPPVTKTAKKMAPARPPSLAEISRQVLRPGGTKRKA